MLNNSTKVLIILGILLLFLSGAVLAQSSDESVKTTFGFDLYGLVISAQWGIIGVLLLALFRQHKFIPREVVIALTREIKEATRLTTTQLDDRVAEILELLVSHLTKESTEENK